MARELRFLLPYRPQARGHPHVIVAINLRAIVVGMGATPRALVRPPGRPVGSGGSIFQEESGACPRSCGILAECPDSPGLIGRAVGFESKERSAKPGRQRHNRPGCCARWKQGEDGLNTCHVPEIDTAIGDGRSPLGAYCCPRQNGGRALVVLGVKHRRLLPAIVPLAHGQSPKCSAP
jgi:hypothetical protein